MDRTRLNYLAITLPSFAFPKMISISICFLLLFIPFNSYAVALPTLASSSSPDAHSIAVGLTSTSSLSSASTTTTTLNNGTWTRTLLSTATTYQDDKDHIQTGPVNASPQSTIASTPTASLPLVSRGAKEKQDNQSTYDHDDNDYQNDQFYPYQQHQHQEHEQHDGPGRDNCVLPDSWKGKWFQSGVSAPFMIDSKSMGEKGGCIERSGDKFLFVASEKNQDCFRCIVINERHRNVLQYKESSYCEEKNSLENLCSQIPGDAQLYSLFRVDAQPEDCPFRGAPFTFTYNRGHGECKNPVSFVDTCTEPSKLLLRYQACPDVLKTESTAEELQCLAQWKEGSHHYLVGKLTRERANIPSNEDSYRCFIYEKIKSGGGGHGGYTVAMSGDATCTGIFSSTEGARTLTFSKADKIDEKCTFPSWLSSHRWYTLDGKISTKMHHKNTTLLVLDNGRNSTGRYEIQGNVFGLPRGIISAGGSEEKAASFFIGGAKIICRSRQDLEDGRHVVIVAKHMHGCKSQEVCIHIYQRTKHVTEIQILRQSDHLDCAKGNTVAHNSPYVTLFNPEAKSKRCPNLGRYMTTTTGGSMDRRVVRDACGPMAQGRFHTLIVGCGDRATMEFHSKCATHNPISSYECHGHWEENGNGFLIASPLSRSSTTAGRYCFNYQETDEGISVISSTDSCRRMMGPGIEDVWAFNLTVDGQCAQAVTGSGAGSNLKACDILLSSLLACFFMFRLMPILHMSSGFYFQRKSQSSLNLRPPISIRAPSREDFFHTTPHTSSSMSISIFSRKMLVCR